ncbi:hypothetical protein FOL47_000938 [Perkinsus chesapeaki]|uniref:5-oxoprolinase n=1 Tax=Perkinsus chesapeaki TaxID=330153 RepID=A0A7J6N298_PERCH|nr:hypothetical protein FOL47_000938 [Perkinsus chesapeaki]
MSDGGKFRFAIDRGGTFTDVYAEVPDGHGGHRKIVRKLLSEDPDNYPDAPREGIRRILQEFTGKPHPAGEPVRCGEIESIRMGTTVATNALLERKGTTCALLVTEGFADLLEIGNQTRPAIFDVKIRRPDTLYTKVVEVPERVVLARETDYLPGRVVKGRTGEEVRIERPLDVETLRARLQILLDEGIQSVAILLMHSYIYGDHEKEVAALCRSMGFAHVSASSEVLAMAKAVARGHTVVADAYLTPTIRTYLRNFCNGFERALVETDNTRLLFMQSDGGLARMQDFTGHKAILSGPAGGVVGFAKTTARALGNDTPVVGFDMGGTSTDVSRYDPKVGFEHIYETVTAGVTVQAPQLDITTVAAGGGSLLTYEHGLLCVGPESAGAHPGPVCYRKRGGKLAVTDANLVLGRLIPSHFPRIFGETQDQPLDVEASRAALGELAAQMGLGDDIDACAAGFIRVANEAMCRPIRNMTQMRGYDVRAHVLACFGGAGGQHACAMARALGIETVFVHRFAGVLSAFGLALADEVVDKQVPAAQKWQANGPWAETLAELEREAVRSLEKAGHHGNIHTKYYLNMRYAGTDTAIMTAVEDGDNGDYQRAFERAYQREYGFLMVGRDLLIDDIRVRARAVKEDAFEFTRPPSTEEYQAMPDELTSAYFEGHGRVKDTPVFLEANLKPGACVRGPAIIVQTTGTIVIEPDCTARVNGDGDYVVDVKQLGDTNTLLNVEVADPIQLSIFSHKFMSIAEQMGRCLQRTATSVNVKDRLDFSCAVFGPDGGLIANAPHIPVHLGAMQEAVKIQLGLWEGKLRHGDVLVSNHPQLAGGSHLPDITVMTPVFEGDNVAFVVASRGHHADVGGVEPGSMPPNSTSLAQEGCAIVTHKLVCAEQGFDEVGITKLLTTAGTRNLEDNLADLRAQVAANQQGISLVHEMVQTYGLKVVHAYLHHIRENARQAVLSMLYTWAEKHGMEGEAEDFMDDGSAIKLKVRLLKDGGGGKRASAIFDFTDSGPEVVGNTNAPPAVTMSAVIYCLRCMVDSDIPLNQGCLEAVQVVLPERGQCMLNPSPTAAVVGGNVVTSQRVVDVIFRAFEFCAASCGCMNNVTFGDETFGYYETVAGGSGAGPTWNGVSGVHTHMTNTRITDVEIMERRYPCIVRRFGLREGSGGEGAHSGGCGVLRELEFVRALHVSVLTERRARSPYGMAGGGCGMKGLNLWLKREAAQEVNIGGKRTVQMARGDRLRLMTPGGGGYGRV